MRSKERLYLRYSRFRLEDIFEWQSIQLERFYHRNRIGRVFLTFVKLEVCGGASSNVSQGIIVLRKK